MILRLVNLSLLVLFPVAWTAPLLRAGLLPFFGGSEITVLSGLAELWQVDPALAALVALFALFAPYAKTLSLMGVQFGWLTARAMPVVKVMGRLAMADIFLIALYILAAKGVGVGYVETAWGLWLFTGCVLTSLAVTYLTPLRN
ncbi:paraquat-inducible protein A [Pukyongiella litopenaei]|uniref:Paraquat-inducible membrane protein A n=1 Tax=Pukyongiella litopenaei TaxID=2605946 RepID=A0A2S0MMF1_9RHOB|nr:paraquat-inducible protein A [Pukyongiella litopenaei]AVO37065.1 paraquat-inducible membrane protein A [Pukyongiella litopenaei]